jgi:hypothetical protein
MQGESLGVDPIAVLGILLPVVCLLAGSNVYVAADATINWQEPLILFTLLVGRKGTKKSPVLKAIIDPLRSYLNVSEESKIDLLFLEGTLEGLTKQLMINNGEMLQVANEAESFLKKLYNQNGKIIT